MTIDKAIRYPIKKNGTTFFPKQKKDPSKVARGPEVSGIPKHFGKGKHRVDLAYITPDEAKLLTDLDMHGTTPPNTGPEIQNIPNYNGWGRGDSFGSTADTDASSDPSTGGSGGGSNTANGGFNQQQQQQQERNVALANQQQQIQQEAGYDATVAELADVAKKYGFVQKNFNIDPDDPFSNFQVSGVPGSTPNYDFLNFDTTTSIQDQIDNQAAQNQQTLNDYSDLGYSFGNLTGTNALGLDLDSLAAQKLANANALQDSANALSLPDFGTAAQRLKDLQIGTDGDEETDRPSFMDNLASDFNAFTSDPLGSTARTLKSGIGNTLNTITATPLTGWAGFGTRTLGNMFNFNPTLDEDGNIRSGIFGPENASLYGRLDVDQYDNPQNIDVQDFMRAAFTFDEDGNYVSKANDYDKLKAYTDSVGATYTGSTAEDLAAQRVADREGNRGRDNISQISSSGGTGGGTGGGGTGGGGTGGDTGEDDSTTNNKTYTSEQERTMAYLGEMGYNRRYQEDYIDKDGVLFNFDEYDDIDFVS